MAGYCFVILLFLNLLCVFDSDFLCRAEDNISKNGNSLETMNTLEKEQPPQLEQTQKTFLTKKDKSYKSRQRLLQLTKIHRLLPPEREEIPEVGWWGDSSNYGLVRPLLRELYLDGADALPALFDHFDNTNYLYSYTAMLNNSVFDAHKARKATVGTIARELFEAIIEPVSSNIASSKGYVSFINEHKNIKEWYQRNQNKSLSELQLEVFDYYIQAGKELGFPDKETEQMLIDKRNQLRKGIPIINPSQPYLYEIR
jgi:hypothetical protein